MTARLLTSIGRLWTGSEIISNAAILLCDDRIAWVGPSAELPVPQHRGSARPGDPQPGRTVHIDQPGQPYAERVTDAKQRRDARIGRALLDADQHSAANTGTLGQLVQGPAPAGSSTVMLALPVIRAVRWQPRVPVSLD